MPTSLHSRRLSPGELARRDQITAELAEIAEARRSALAAEATARTVQHRASCARYVQHLNLRTLVLHAQLAA
jgi:hypothetical protein